MPIKLRRAKTRTTKITDEAVAAFRTVERLQPKYLGCIRGTCDEKLHSKSHCSDCAECIDASRALRRELRLAPYEACPSDVTDSGPCPDYRHGSCWGESWPKAQELRREILAAIERSRPRKNRRERGSGERGRKQPATR